jgi:hypothetical protein
MSSLQHAEDKIAPRTGRPAEDFAATLDHLGMLRFGGEDAEAFLQGQLSCDVARAGATTSIHGAYCTPKGRMLANFLLWREEDGFSMALSRDLAASVHKHISKFVLRSKVKIADASDSIVLVGATGAQVQRSLANFPAPPVKLGDGRLLLPLPPAAVSGALRGIRLANAAHWRWLDIRAGLPWVTAATQDQLIPQMANLELIGGVSFDKGCYTGQEIVARTQHLGTVKRRTFLANVTAAASAGDPLYSEDLGEQASGMVVNAESSPDGGYDLLAAVQISSKERSIVHLKTPDGPALRFLPLPYVVP